MKTKLTKLFAAVLALACLFSVSTVAMAASYSQDEILLARLIQMEGSSASDRTAVASVVLNRLENTARWGEDDLESVIYQKNQFSVVSSSKFSSLDPSTENLEIAREVLENGSTLPLGVEFFRAESKGKGVKKSDGLYYWGSHPYYQTIGNTNYYFATKEEYNAWAEGRGSSEGGQSTSESGGSGSTLRRGDSGSDVKALQQLLQAAGYSLSADGVFGSATEQAVRQFQAREGLTQDGIAGPATLAALKEEGDSVFIRLLRKGSSGSDVRALQRLLQEEGYSLSADGIFGADTAQTLRHFQEDNGLAADGIAGQNTITALGGRWDGASYAFIRLLKQGCTGSDVERLQQLLNGEGASLAVDGVFGSKTRSAVRQYQEAHSLTVDGIAGKNTLAALGESWRGSSFSRLLRQGARGSDVTSLQQLLRLEGFSLAADGVFGPATEGALRRLQARRGLTQDGVAGPKTISALGGGWQSA